MGHFGSFWVIPEPFWAIWGHIWPFWVIFGPFWIILGHSRAMLDHLGPFGVIFGPLLGILGHFWPFFGPFRGIFGQICGKLKFFCGHVGVVGLPFRMYDIAPLLQGWNVAHQAHGHLYLTACSARTQQFGESLGLTKVGTKIEIATYSWIFGP